MTAVLSVDISYMNEKDFVKVTEKRNYNCFFPLPEIFPDTVILNEPTVTMQFSAVESTVSIVQ